MEASFDDLVASVRSLAERVEDISETCENIFGRKQDFIEEYKRRNEHLQRAHAQSEETISTQAGEITELAKALEFVLMTDNLEEEDIKGPGVEIMLKRRAHALESEVKKLKTQLRGMGAQRYHAEARAAALDAQNTTKLSFLRPPSESSGRTDSSRSIYPDTGDDEDGGPPKSAEPEEEDPSVQDIIADYIEEGVNRALESLVSMEGSEVLDDDDMDDRNNSVGSTF